MSLEIAFQTRELRATCESPARAKRELGEAEAKALRRVLADMSAVDVVAELFELGLVEDHVQGHEVLQFPLSEAVSLYCSVNQQKVPMSGGSIDWAKVSRLKVIRIGGRK